MFNSTGDYQARLKGTNVSEFSSGASRVLIVNAKTKHQHDNYVCFTPWWGLSPKVVFVSLIPDLVWRNFLLFQITFPSSCATCVSDPINHRLHLTCVSCVLNSLCLPCATVSSSWPRLCSQPQLRNFPQWRIILGRRVISFVNNFCSWL